MQVPIVDRLNLSQVEPGRISRFWLELTTSGLGNPLRIPMLVARGYEDGPTLGVTAVVQGNALNGLPVIRQLFQNLDLENLSGAVVGLPVMNMPGFVSQQGRFLDGADLNRIMPGRLGGNISETYTYRLMDRAISTFDYLVDLQTAAFGQVNIYYVRADMTMRKQQTMARLFNPDAVLHDPAPLGTLRRAALDINIQALTVIAGGPHRFQQDAILPSRMGLFNLLVSLDMQGGEIEVAGDPPLECPDGYWMRTTNSGLLEVFPGAGADVEKGEPVGRLTNVFGDLIEEYHAHEHGFVLSKSVNPVCEPGGAIVLLGIPRNRQ